MEWSLFDAQGRRKYLVPIERTAFLRAALTAGGQTATLCAVLTFTGARISEVLALKPLDLDEANGTINVQTLKRRKSGVIRAVPVPHELFLYLNGVHHWREARENAIGADRRLWTFSRTTAWRRVKYVAQLANSPQYLRSPKVLRHAFGVDARIKGVPIELIKICLGHARIETTFIYTTVVGPEERDFIGRTWHENSDLLSQPLS
jgi:integrase